MRSFDPIDLKTIRRDVAAASADMNAPQRGIGERWIFPSSVLFLPLSTSIKRGISEIRVKGKGMSCNEVSTRKVLQNPRVNYSIIIHREKS